jgi:alpha-L-fucosidase
MQQRLLEIGQWLRVHGAAIYGAHASPFWPRRFEWGMISAKPGKLYLHVFDPGTTRLQLTGLANEVKQASILEHPDKPGLQTTPIERGIELQWPWYLNNEAVTVIALDVDGEPQVDKAQQQFSDGRIDLLCHALKIHGTKAHVYYRGHGPRMRIRDWTDPKEYLSATLDVTQTGPYDVLFTYAASPDQAATAGRSAGPDTDGSRLVVEIGDQRIKHPVVNTGGEERFKTFDVGCVDLEEPGRYRLTIRPDPESWRGLGLQSVTLKPMVK